MVLLVYHDIKYYYLDVYATIGILIENVHKGSRFWNQPWCFYEMCEGQIQMETLKKLHEKWINFVKNI